MVSKFTFEKKPELPNEAVLLNNQVNTIETMFVLHNKDIKFLRLHGHQASFWCKQDQAVTKCGTHSPVGEGPG